ncbi:maleylacetoacetate isomerase [Acinetobacter proteolyticus]|uniref:Maleylacetoacetate isomerase n=1 Tax=Acinetobacter proteolyticus TaxID=1776741 RepID=A0A1E7R680_9GAMM|nr:MULTISPECIES: maleylacetoacetate isomerase [Acinetobacter]QHH95074.1 maleylacetoacetate isomerase [Acinetobacter gyllenbergii]ENU24243.1 maleylacetoacetate isomerase [Acinetobacter proteolyticus]ESK54756.1 maleylacetoacetate isomerase [Acinetobacter gyllenbergii NIPH 230]MCH7340030.1 maleylacetoacetate isomerase [Acinetobacter higginsii]MCI3878037.1 maleylacetoacetate isomerase [Acinetobacter higginsii]
MKLYSYFRSSAAYRVRIALNLKALPYETEAVHLVKNEQQLASYRALNPSQLVPTLLDQDQTFTQSLSILEYLEERYPAKALLPKDLVERAKVRAFAQSIACDIHPINNLRVLKYLQNDLAISNEQKTLWYRHWILEGFHSLEMQLQHSNGQFCFGSQPTFADCCLIPQVYNAKRFKIDLSAFPKIESIYQHCLTLPAFLNATPEQQPDWE